MKIEERLEFDRVGCRASGLSTDVASPVYGYGVYYTVVDWFNQMNQMNQMRMDGLGREPNLPPRQTSERFNSTPHFDLWCSGAVWRLNSRPYIGLLHAVLVCHAPAR
jgi:hypothetical protein